jgi:hypothetical protein
VAEFSMASYLTVAGDLQLKSALQLLRFLQLKRNLQLQGEPYNRGRKTKMHWRKSNSA